jgi:hypothetical protein
VEVTDYFNSVFQALTVTELRPLAGTPATGSPSSDAAPAVTTVTRDAELDVTAMTGRTHTLSVRWELELSEAGRISLLRVGWDTAAIGALMFSG